MGCSNSHTSPERMQASEKVIKAAIIIQIWFRRYSARLETRRRATWKIFQCLEYSGEQDQLKLQNFFNDIILHFPESEAAKRIHGSTNPEDTDDMNGQERRLLRRTDPDIISINQTYTGPTITVPLDRGQLEVLIDAFKRKKLLHAKYVLQILHEVRKVLKQKGNISHATTSFAKQVTVCGDLHGKIDDLFTIFHKNGIPSPDNPYVFNGDFVDRGPYSVEIAMLLFTCIILYPNDVCVNRGNHEDHVLNLRYGFTKEVMHKYHEHASAILKLFQDVFSWLPFMTIVDDKVLITHGGISDKTDLNVISNLARHTFKSVLKPPFQELPSSDECDESHTRSQRQRTNIMEWKQVIDLLWSDPNSEAGCTPNTFRGGGCYFGADVTANFLKKCGLKLLIRSHECKREGFEYTHGNQVLTVFSASNYYGEGSNKGAYVKLGQDLEPRIVQFTSTGKTMSAYQKVSLTEETALKDLREKLHAMKTPLMEQFQELDPNKTRCISLSEWCTTLTHVLNMEMPWRTLCNKLTRLTSSGKVLYESTFSDFKIEHKYSVSGPSVTETLYRNREILGTIFRILDKDNSGQISMQEFEDACDLLGRHTNSTTTADQVRDLATSIDINKDGCIDFNEFLEAFRLVNLPSHHEQNVETNNSLNTEEADVTIL